MGSPGPFTIFTIFISPRYKTARPKAGVLTGTNSCTATLVVDFMATLVHDGQGPDGFLPPWGSPEGMDALRQQLAQCLKTGAVDRCRSIVNCQYMSIQCILYIIYNSIYAIVLGLIFEFQHPRYPRSMQPLGPQDLLANWKQVADTVLQCTGDCADANDIRLYCNGCRVKRAHGSSPGSSLLTGRDCCAETRPWKNKIAKIKVAWPGLKPPNPKECILNYLDKS